MRVNAAEVRWRTVGSVPWGNGVLPDGGMLYHMQHANDFCSIHAAHTFCTPLRVCRALPAFVHARTGPSPGNPA